MRIPDTLYHFRRFFAPNNSFIFLIINILQIIKSYNETCNYNNDLYSVIGVPVRPDQQFSKKLSA